MIKKILINTILILVGVPILLVTSLKFINPPVWGWQINRTFFPPESYPDNVLHSWLPIEHISPDMTLAVIASEDQQFANHYGVDIDSTLNALSENSTSSRRGASTITQQTAKNLLLFPSQTYVRKAYELYIALLMELILGKQRIIELYLNIIEFGPGIYGVEAASQFYFGTSASQLSRVQCAQLAVVLPNPYRISPVPATPYVQQRTQWVIQQMSNLGSIPL
ncbi:monofunctional biosynthetic peptidoglycan transglycosylase [Vibrio sp. ZSDZ65]|uniref:Biosynthetic peptidoglycan transglycosylase n=1 Tax=Vibrio qingdaonensis TaxID=2829491 RepID=A0A9X3HYB0_9VIBR|nr:monofunctional biosynthetic peptidoglycan transglycosylase [Vibrio qingdaonensis]MCW8348620.1 monofunctional biosynthetic peptidoglycan transglycosylase [Vibrio qingdaonensis]